jgi:hypothetical protein
MNDISSEGQLRSVKNNLEEWREVVIKADALLGWEVDWYPAVTGGVLTAAFLFIWYWDPTLLTFFAFMGLVVTLTDYAGPKIVNQICGPESWNGTKEKQFEKVCDEIVSTRDNVHAAVNACRDARSKKPFIHFIVTVMTLISLAWIGNRINNFFLAYLLTLGVAMLPGLHRRGILQKHFSQLSIKFGELLKGQNILKKEM